VTTGNSTEPVLWARVKMISSVRKQAVVTTDKINKKNKHYKRELKTRRSGEIRSISSNWNMLILLVQCSVHYFEVQI
jgi:hypothetical protein